MFVVLKKNYFCVLKVELFVIFKGDSALTIACHHQFISIAVLLIASGAEVHQFIQNELWCTIRNMMCVMLREMMSCHVVRVGRQLWKVWEKMKIRSCCVMLWMHTATITSWNNTSLISKVLETKYYRNRVLWFVLSCGDFHFLKIYLKNLLDCLLWVVYNFCKKTPINFEKNTTLESLNLRKMSC